MKNHGVKVYFINSAVKTVVSKELGTSGGKMETLSDVAVVEGLG